MTARNFLCTLNLDQADGWQQYLEDLKAKTNAEYIVGQLEKGEEKEHLHIQFFVNFKQPCRVSAITKHDKRIHCERVKVNNGADAYCMKEETRVEGPIELGTKPVKLNSKNDWEQVWKLASEGKLEQIPASIRVMHYNKLKQIAKDHMAFKDKDHLRGIWVYGPAGSGKSRWAREQSESIYPKLCNKWWDGYQGERVVVMDDFMPEHKILCQQLKIWSDRYDCILETKGGAVHSDYEWLIVTSQYSIEEIWEDDRDRSAISRRFQQYSIEDIQKLKLTLVTLSQCHAACYNTQASGVTDQKLELLN